MRSQVCCARTALHEGATTRRHHFNDVSDRRNQCTGKCFKFGSETVETDQCKLASFICIIIASRSQLLANLACSQTRASSIRKTSNDRRLPTMGSRFAIVAGQQKTGYWHCLLQQSISLLRIQLPNTVKCPTSMMQCLPASWTAISRFLSLCKCHFRQNSTQ